MGKRKCNSCGARVIERPIWKGQEFGEKFSFDKINWKNMIIGDWTYLLIFITLLGVGFAYSNDTAVARDIYEHPCEFVKKNVDACLNYGENFNLQIQEGLIINPIGIENNS